MDGYVRATREREEEEFPLAPSAYALPIGVPRAVRKPRGRTCKPCFEEKVVYPGQAARRGAVLARAMALNRGPRRRVPRWRAGYCRVRAQTALAAQLAARRAALTRR